MFSACIFAFIYQLQHYNKILTPDPALRAHDVITCFYVNATKKFDIEMTSVYLLLQLLQMIQAVFWWLQLYCKPCYCTALWTCANDYCFTHFQDFTAGFQNGSHWIKFCFLYYVCIHLLYLSISIICNFIFFIPLNLFELIVTCQICIVIGLSKWNFDLTCIFILLFFNHMNYSSKLLKLFARQREKS